MIFVNLIAIRNTVTVRIRIVGIRTVLELFKVSQTIVVRILPSHGRIGDAQAVGDLPIVRDTIANSADHGVDVYFDSRRRSFIASGNKGSTSGKGCNQALVCNTNDVGIAARISRSQVERAQIGSTVIRKSARYSELYGLPQRGECRSCGSNPDGNWRRGD